MARISRSAWPPAKAVALWHWFTVHELTWTAEVMLRRPASELRRRFASPFGWEVVRPFRKQLNRTLLQLDDSEWLVLERMFEPLTRMVADWQTERALLGGPAGPPAPLRPRREALLTAEPAIIAVERLLSVTWDFRRPLHDQVPDLPEGIIAVPEDQHVMVVLGEAYYTPADAEERGEPPLDELLIAIAGGIEAGAGPPALHDRWSDPSLRSAPIQDGTEAWVWATPWARIALTSFEYDHHPPALVHVFILPPDSFPRQLAALLWGARRRATMSLPVLRVMCSDGWLQPPPPAFEAP